jgi:hypothetical protein
MYRLHLQGIRNPRISYTLKMEVIRSSETSVNKISTRCHIPEDGILRSHHRGNLKSYIITIIFIYFLLGTGAENCSTVLDISFGLLSKDASVSRLFSVEDSTSNEYGAVGRMRICKGNRSIRRKHIQRAAGV